ncbi:MAG: YihY/virulence factor BrkB family protein, partial [Actinomycetota bacterium]
MRTVGTDHDKDLEPQRAGASRLSWGALAKTAAAVLVARAAQRVLGRPTRLTRTPEQGRLGGAVTAIPAPRRVERPAAEPRARDQRPPATDKHAPGAAPAPPQGALGTAKTAFKEFGKDNGTLMAAAVAFYILIALVPLVLVGIGIMGYVMADPEAQSKVLDFTARFMPGRSGILRDMVVSATEARQGLAGIGLITLLFTALGGFTALENAINVTWGTPNRNFLMSKLFALGMFVLIGALLILTIGISCVITWARAMPGVSWLGDSWVAAALGFGFLVPYTLYL